MTISREIMELCSAKGIRIRQSTDEMIVLENVPLDAQALSKPATKLCVIRDKQSQRFLAWVDADLQPKQPSHHVARWLTGQMKEHWQLVAPPEGFPSAEQAIVRTVRRLTGDEVEPPGSDRPLRGTLLPQVARRIRKEEARPALWHREQALEMAESLVRHASGMVVLAGASGSGL